MFLHSKKKQRQSRKGYGIGALVTVGLVAGAATWMYSRRGNAPSQNDQLDQRLANDEEEAFADLHPNQIPDVEPLPPREPL